MYIFLITVCFNLFTQGVAGNLPYAIKTDSTESNSHVIFDRSVDRGPIYMYPWGAYSRDELKVLIPTGFSCEMLMST